MAWSDILGFLFVLFIFFFPLLRKVLMNRHQKKETPAPVEEPEEDLPLPPPPVHVPRHTTERMVNDKYEYHSRLEPKKKKQKAKHVDDPLASVLRGKTPLQAMMIASEILGKPVSLRDEP